MPDSDEFPAEIPENVQTDSLKKEDKEHNKAWKTIGFLLEQFENDCNLLFCQYLSHLGEQSHNASKFMVSKVVHSQISL